MHVRELIAFEELMVKVFWFWGIAGVVLVFTFNFAFMGHSSLFSNRLGY